MRKKIKKDKGESKEPETLKTKEKKNDMTKGEIALVRKIFWQQPEEGEINL